jgi:hypothetical protein
MCTVARFWTGDTLSCYQASRAADAAASPRPATPPLTSLPPPPADTLWSLVPSCRRTCPRGPTLIPPCRRTCPPRPASLPWPSSRRSSSPPRAPPPWASWPLASSLPWVPSMRRLRVISTREGARLRRLASVG